MSNLSCLFPKAAHRSYPPLVRALYGGSLIFFITDASGIIVNTTIQVLYYSRPLNEVALMFALTIVSITGQRLALNLRHLSLRQGQMTPTQLSEVVDRQIGALATNSSASAPAAAAASDPENGRLFGLTESSVGTTCRRTPP
ncbi:hypothetical protein HYDPIDRAFT_23066 [Hydnomerulius pinastri MD-312]|nr:hypothetical protein HYDPIDRAFT_23066 [Hydnomerulius pinastri MD-312]